MEKDTLKYYQSEENYEGFLHSGMFWEYFPHLSGSWRNDENLWKYLMTERWNIRNAISYNSEKSNIQHQDELTFFPPPSKDPIVESVVKDLRERSKKGIQEYGIDLTRKDYSLLDWMRELYSEQLDSAAYTKRMIIHLEKYSDLAKTPEEELTETKPPK